MRTVCVDRETLGHLVVLAWTRWMELELEVLEAAPADLAMAQSAASFAARVVRNGEAALAFDRPEAGTAAGEVL